MIDGPTTRRRLLSSVLLFALVFIVSSSGLILHAGDGFAATATALNGITLTEFMAAPNDALGASAFRDEDGDTVDWIELYNAGAELVNLAGWSLTDNPDRLAKWRFAGETILVPGAYLVVFASGKDRRAANGVLHTNFSLRQEGGFLALVDASGSVASAYSPLYPPQYTGVSYGIDPEPSDPNGYSDRHRYMTEATPGAGNRSPGPAIGLVSHTPNQLLEGSDLNISADVESASALTRVTLHYRSTLGPNKNSQWPR